jgi:UDP-2-acetamido-3-amino-2,3-dideoxy-glucuronate N-acetyltransferase
MTSDYSVHPTAVVDAGAEVGKGTKIWHFCHLKPGARVGQYCNIGQNVFIDDNVLIGNGVKIQNNVSIYNGVTVEDGAFLGPSMVFTNVINPRSFIERKAEFKHTLVKKGASIGANATIVCGVEIGQYAMIGAGAVVVRNIPAFALVVGNPARQLGWVSVSGEKLIFDDRGIAWCNTEKKKYRLADNSIVEENGE